MTDPHTLTLKDNRGPWLVLKGEDVAELETTLRSAFPAIEGESFAELVHKAQVEFSAIGNAVYTEANGVVAAGPVVPAATGAAVPAVPASIAPSCRHGQRVYKSGVKGDNKWQAWFCAEPKESTDKCKAEWIR